MKINAKGYKTDILIKKEMIAMVEWVRYNQTSTLQTSEELVELYLEDQDISLHGKITKLEKNSQRNPLRELLIMASAVIVALFLFIIVLTFWLAPELHKAGIL